MSLFRFAKYSTILFFFGKYKNRIFRIVAVLLFAAVTSLLYQDVADYLHREHPGAVIYALIVKIIIVYGALAFVLWQFRPSGDNSGQKSQSTASPPASDSITSEKPKDRLSELENIDDRDRLGTRYDNILHKYDKNQN